MVSLWLQRTLHFCNHHVRCMVAKLLCLLQVNVLGKIVEHSWIFCLCFRRMRSYVPWRGSLGNACWWVVAMDLNQLPNVLTMSRLSRMQEASAEREVRSLHDLCMFQSDMFSNALIFPTWKATIMKPCKPHIKTHLHLVHNLLYRWQNCIPKMMTCASYFVSQYIVKIIWCPKFEKCKKYGKLGNPLLENIRMKGWLLALYWFVTNNLETSRIWHAQIRWIFWILTQISLLWSSTSMRYGWSWRVWSVPGDATTEWSENRRDASDATELIQDEDVKQSIECFGGLGGWCFRR